MDTILNVSELVNAVSGVQKESKSGYFGDSDRFWIQILNVSELENAVSGVQKESKSGYFGDSDRFWIQILNVSELENAVSGVQKESKSGNRVPFGPPLPCGCNLVLFVYPTEIYPTEIASVPIYPTEISISTTIL